MHGLNMKPACMLDLASVWLDAGYAVVLGVLRGHGEQSPDSEWAAVTMQDWLEDMAACRREAGRLAAGKPVWLCGFSLGAACGFAEYVQSLGGVSRPATSCRGAAGGPPCPHAACGFAEYINIIENTPRLPGSLPPYAGMILFSPAIRLRPWAHAVRLLFRWPRVRLSSLAGVRYRVHDHTSIAAYRALFGLRACIKARLAWWRRTRGESVLPPLLIVYDAKDVLTAGRAFGRWLPRKRAALYHRVRANNPWHHLITDRRALGEAAWQELTALIRGMLNPG